MSAFTQFVLAAGAFLGAIATPEPGTLTLLGSGLASLIGYGWRRGKRAA